VTAIRPPTLPPVMFTGPVQARVDELHPQASP
jgi:hypothetical protein